MTYTPLAAEQKGGLSTCKPKKVYTTPGYKIVLELKHLLLINHVSI